jgi:hypothetical protein
MDVMASINRHIKHDPAMRKRLATHRRERKPCVFCGGPYAATVRYWDPRLLVTGTLFVGLYNTCRACRTRADFRERVAAEYAEDVAQARQQGLPSHSS